MNVNASNSVKIVKLLENGAETDRVVKYNLIVTNIFHNNIYNNYYLLNIKRNKIEFNIAAVYREIRSFYVVFFCSNILVVHKISRKL